MLWRAFFMCWGIISAVPQFLHLPCWCTRSWGQHLIPSDAPCTFTLLLQGTVVSLEFIMSQNERQQASGLRQIDMCKQSRSLPSDSGVQMGITISVALHIYWLVTCSQAGAAEIPADQPWLSVDDLADQVAEVLDYFGWVSKSISFSTPMWILVLFSWPLI
jgi:hypothetical protein